MNPLDIAATLVAGEGIPPTWLFLRVTGIVSLALLTLAVVLGIGGPAVRRPAARLPVVAIHRAAAMTGLVLLAAHVLLAVADSYVDIPPLALVVPGVSRWQPLWVGLGALAVDLLLLVGITTATRLRAPRLWRRAHLLAYPAWLVAWLHALTAGTDAGSLPMVVLALAGAAGVLVAATARLMRPDVTRDSRGLTGPAAPEPARRRKEGAIP